MSRRSLELGPARHPCPRRDRGRNDRLLGVDDAGSEQRGGAKEERRERSECTGQWHGSITTIKAAARAPVRSEPLHRRVSNR
jgi:hypothetical protein